MSDSVQVYRRLLGYARPYWRTAAVALLAMGAAAAGAAGAHAAAAPGGQGPDRQGPAGRLAPAAAAGPDLRRQGLVDYVANVASQAVAQHAMSDLRQEVFRHQTGLPLAEHQSRSHGRMLSSILNDIPLLSQALSSAWIIVIRDTLIIIGLTIKLFLLAWHLTLLILLVAPVVAMLIRVASRKLRVSNEAMRTLAGQLAGQLEAGLSGSRS
jgi:subfamily B ATP-binding cassette protein MsbA